MTVVDFHQHLWPEPFIRALERRSEPPRLRRNRLELAREGAFEVDLADHDLDRRLARLDRDGIDVAVVSLQPTCEVEGRFELVEGYHEGILEMAAASDGRVRPLAAGEYHDGFAGACVSAAALVAGVDGLGTELEAAGRPLFVHPGPPERVPREAPAWWAAVVDYPAQMQAAYAAWLARGAAEHPQLSVVFAILAGGGPFQLERLRARGGLDDRAGLLPTVYFDTASYGRHALELCVDAVGARQLVFGSDTPILDAGPGLRSLVECGQAVADAACRENPTRLLA